MDKAVQSAPGGDRRRSERLLLVMPVILTYNGEGDVTIREDAESEQINRHGALLRVKMNLPRQAVVTLVNPRNKSSVDAHVVVESGQRGPDGWFRVAVEFKSPSTKFWGVHFPEEQYMGDIKKGYTPRRPSN